MDRSTKTHEGAPRAGRRRGDRGASMVELSLVLLILSLFVFGIISFGYLFSFRQNLTQAAAEGARAGAVAASTSTAPTDATAAVNSAIQSSFGKACGTGGLSCGSPTVATCTYPVGTTQQCITVTLTFDYAHHPLLPDAPVISSFMPSSITVSSTARVS